MFGTKYLIVLALIGAITVANACHDDEIDMDPFNLNINGKNYWIEGTQKANWYDAAHICRASGGHLASIEIPEELRALSSYLLQTKHNNTNDWFWLSGNDLGREGQFYWLRTGETMTYADWSDFQPDNAGGAENCVHLWLKNGRFRMNDWVCDRRAYFICQASDFTVVTYREH